MLVSYNINKTNTQLLDLLFGPSNKYAFVFVKHNSFILKYHLLEVPRGLGRSRNVSKRLWDILEVLYIELLINIYKNQVKQSVFGTGRP